MPPARFVLLGVGSAGIAGAAWTLQKYNRGELTYGPVRTPGWISEQLATTPQITRLAANPTFVPVRPFDLFDEQLGGISTPKVFRDRENPRHTITFVHCGPRACGFPFLVHGGVLGTVIYNAIRHAEDIGADDALKGTVKFTYKSPTVVDQILQVETTSDPEKPNGLRAEIRTLDGKLRVIGEYNTK